MRTGMVVAFFAVSVLAGFGLVETASAQCSTIGAKVCQGHYIYICQPCGSEKCLIATSTKCHRDEAPDTFMGAQLDQPQARLCSNAVSALDRALHGVQVRQPVRARVLAVQVVAVPVTVPALN